MEYSIDGFLSIVQFNYEVFYFFSPFGLDDLSVAKSVILKSSIIILSGPICPFLSSNAGFFEIGYTDVQCIYIYIFFVFILAVLECELRALYLLSRQPTI
jgi:hypothetical protein